MPASRPTSRTVLSPASRQLVGGLLIAAGALLLIAYSLQLYVLLHLYRAEGVLGSGPLLRVLLGLTAGAGTVYAGWRVGLHRPPPRK